MLPRVSSNILSFSKWQQPDKYIISSNLYPLDKQTICCSHYHYNDSVLLIGDAAHATSPSLGQGCNAAFEDVVIFNTLLNEYSDNWAEALAQFTLRRKPDAHALVELSDNAFPMSNKLLLWGGHPCPPQ